MARPGEAPRLGPAALGRTDPRPAPPQTTELVQFLAQTFDPSMPNWVGAQSFAQCVTDALVCDWHTSPLTKHLHPSPSLPSAVYNPHAFRW